MKPTDRIQRILSLDTDRLLASDSCGRLHVLESDFTLVRSSPALPENHPIYCLERNRDVVITKDTIGTVAKWCLTTLSPTNVLNAANLRGTGHYEADEEPSPVSNHGLAVWSGNVYVNNGYVELVTIDLDSFDVIRVSPSFSPTYIEWVCTDRAGQQVVSDKNGTLYLGSLTTAAFPVTLKLDAGNLHRVKYDRRFDRYWVTQDSGDAETAYVSNGVITVRPSGEIDQSMQFARDDVEALEFSPDFLRVYAGGFDGELLIFDNSEPTLKIIRAVRPFSHQIVDITVGADGSVWVLSQDGEIERLDSNGDRRSRMAFNRQCVWDLQHDPVRRHSLVAALDDGIAFVSIRDQPATTIPNLSIDARLGLDVGFVRRLLPLSDGSVVGIGRGQRLFRVRRDGHVVWDRLFDSLLHSIAVGTDGRRGLVAAGQGAEEFDVDNGVTIRPFDIGAFEPWVVTYIEGGEVCVISHDGQVFVIPDDATEPEWSLSLGFGCYPKRAWQHRRYLFVSGGAGIKQIDLAKRSVIRRWTDLQDNTAENGIVCDGRLYVGTYGRQLAVYDLKAPEALGVIENLYGFPKGLATVRSREGFDLLIVGGRGGYLNLYRISDTGEPHLLRTVWVPSEGAEPRSETNRDAADHEERRAREPEVVESPETRRAYRV